MKTIKIFVILMVIASFAPAAAQSSDWETYESVNALLSIREPGAPVIHENSVIFTADSSIRRIGVSFAYENFMNTYWFKLLLIPNDRINPVMLPGEKEPSPHKDSGIQFYVHQVPEHIKDLEYRLVINGLWTVDPSNPQTIRDPLSGLSYSILKMPQRQNKHNPLKGLPDGLLFVYNGPPGETVTVAGNFNSWDPFMYELKEGPAGAYSILLPLPPGTYQYVFFHRGQRHIDIANPKRVYARDGKAASEITIP